MKPNGTPQSTPIAQETLHAHTLAVERFLSELYSTMIDPCAEGEIKVEEMQQRLLDVARLNRQALYDAHSEIARLKGLLTGHQMAAESLREITVPLTPQQNIDIVSLRDCLVALRDSVYCPECRCPNWATARGERISHYEDCKLGAFTELLLKIAPKEGTQVRWKQE